MKLVSFLLLLQVMLLSAAPALALLADTACCAAACEQPENEISEQEHHGDAGEQCNPFGCAGCCVLILEVPHIIFKTSPAAQGEWQPAALVVNAPLQPQWGVWHPPKLS